MRRQRGRGPLRPKHRFPLTIAALRRHYGIGAPAGSHVKLCDAAPTSGVMVVTAGYRIERLLGRLGTPSVRLRR
jgi:hypothetical protein